MGLVDVTCHTDPACPGSGGSEPQRRRLGVLFGAGMRFTYVLVGRAPLLDMGAAAVSVVHPVAGDERWGAT